LRYSLRVPTCFWQTAWFAVPKGWLNDARALFREAADYPDSWMDEMDLDRATIRPTKQSSSQDFQGADHVIQLNGLPKIE